MPTAAIITAAGSGKRFGEYKQFKILGEVPLLFHSVKTFSHIKEIAEIKMADLNASDIEGAMKIIAGTARSMGIDIEE